MNGRVHLVMAVGVMALVCSQVFAGAASLQPVGLLPGIQATEPTGVSADGSVVVGCCGQYGVDKAFRWENGVISDLGFLPGGELWSQGWDVSANGSVIVGGSGPKSAPEAFRWTDGVMSSLGVVVPGTTYSAARGVSADGGVVVGYSGDAAFRWEDDVMTALGGALPGTPRRTGRWLWGRAVRRSAGKTA